MATIEIRKWKLACFLSWTICFLYVTLISTQSYFLPQPICSIVPNDNGDDDNYGSFYSIACVSVVSGFLSMLMMLSVRILQSNPGNERIPSIIALSVIFLGFLSTLSFVAFNFNGVCIDMLGYVLRWLLFVLFS